MAKVKKAQFGLLAKYAGKEVAENLAKSTAKAAAKRELAKGAEKMATKNLPAAVRIKKAASSNTSYRPTSLSERMSGARDEFKRSTQSKSASSSSNKSATIKKDYQGDNFKYKKGGKVAANGKQMIKRADGSYSQRGLWDNIRAAKGSGKKPTAAMLKQEKKIKAKTKK
jgi:hypothetical protein